MTLGALDLSIVTARIIDELEAAESHTQIWDADPNDKFDIVFSGEHPHDPPASHTCRVNVYLFAVNPDPAHRNTFPLGGRPRTVPEHPLGLTLHYLLSAQADSFVREQQAMSVALKCLHEHPVMSAAVPLETHMQRFTVTMEQQSADEIGRLWLALATPLRLSAIYRAEVLFLEPKAPKATTGGIVREPHVDVFALSSPPLQSAPTSTSIAVVTGAGFDAATIELELEGRSLAVVGSLPLNPGEVYVVSPAELQMRFPTGTPHGTHVLRVTLAVHRPVEEVALEVRRDVP